jgi:hypothetical protein
MSDDLQGLERIPTSMHQSLRSYVNTVREHAGAQCLSVTVFGAIAAGTFDPAHHTVRNVVVLETIDLEVLRRFAKEGMKLGKAKISAPLIMTPDYIQQSVDSFPLEFLEIQQQHVCVSGTDYFQSLALEDSFIRLQAEREIKTILIGMRQGLLAAAGREKLLSEIEGDVVERLVRTLRGLLWLHQQRDPLPALNVLAEVEKSVNRTFSGIRQAVGGQGNHGWEEFQRLYTDVDALRGIINAW